MRRPPDAVGGSRGRSSGPISTASRLGTRPCSSARPTGSRRPPRLDVYWIDANDPAKAMLRAIRQSRHEQIVVARGSLDEVLGVLRKQDLLDLHLDGKLQPSEDSGDAAPTWLAALREPLVVHDGATVLQVLDTFKKRPVQMALVFDEYGMLRGVVTQTDLLEALAGEIPDAEDEPAVKEREDGSFLVDGTTPIHDTFDRIGLGKIPDDGSEYRTLAGFVLSRLGRIPAAGDHFDTEGDEVWRFEVVDMDGRRIDKVLISKASPGSPTAPPATA